MQRGSPDDIERRFHAQQLKSKALAYSHQVLQLYRPRKLQALKSRADVPGAAGARKQFVI